jgi:two-component system, NtrC family, sensor kinase
MMQSTHLEASVHAEELAQLKAQVETLEELLQLYEQSATEQEQHLQGALQKLQERAQQLEHAQSTLQTLQTILDSMGDAVVVVNQVGQPLFINPAAKVMLKGESLERSFHHWIENYEIFIDNSIDPCSTAELPLSRAIQGENIDTSQLRIVNKATCETQWLSVNARPLGADGNLTGAVAVFRDISQLKQFEQTLQHSNQTAQAQTQLLQKTLQQLRQTQAQLIQGEKMSSLGQTVAGIAHEINNPVNFIHGNLKPTRQAFEDLLDLIDQFQKTYPEPAVELLEMIENIDLSFLAKDIPEMITSMQAGTERIRDIVKSLRVFSRLDESAVKAVDIHQGIDSALMLLQAKLTQPQSNIQTDLQTDLQTNIQTLIQIHKAYGDLPLIECYASQLNQAFVNLLCNAIDALAAAEEKMPTITIRTKVLKGQAIIQIFDNGIGISKDTQSKIFDPFFTTKPVGQGTGLGLSVCYQIIVETHGGYLECFSREGKGTQFVIKLPIKVSQRSSPIDAEPDLSCL